MQRPANDWEWHILGEVGKRVNKAAPHLASSYMTVSRLVNLVWVKYLGKLPWRVKRITLIEHMIFVMNPMKVFHFL